MRSSEAKGSKNLARKVVHREMFISSERAGSARPFSQSLAPIQHFLYTGVLLTVSLGVLDGGSLGVSDGGTRVLLSVR